MSMHGREGSKGEGKRRVRVWKEIEGRQREDRRKTDGRREGKEGDSMYF